MASFINKVNILYEDNHLLVVVKPENIPTCADESHDIDLLSILKNYLKEKYQKPGNVYLGLVHRLDRPVSGVMVFAKTSKCASRLGKQLNSKEFVKKYYAVVLGNLKSNGTFEDYLLKDNKTNMVKVDLSGKIASLNYEVIANKQNMSLVEVKLNTGRAHQIRVQFASHGFPLYGDQKYNKKAIRGEQIALFSHFLSFKHPITNEVLEFNLELPKRYPFNLFN